MWECCQHIQPFVIIDAGKLNALWTKGEVPGTRYGVSSRGWVDQQLFQGWLVEHFLQHCVSSCPLLLLLDGHSSHFEPETIRIAKEENIIIFCLPPHTTHELQPLDCTLFGPLKTAWADVCHSFFKQYPGQVVSKLNFLSALPLSMVEGCDSTKYLRWLQKSRYLAL